MVVEIGDGVAFVDEHPIPNTCVETHRRGTR